MTISKIKDEFDPNRCQATIRNSGQCLNKQHPGSNYCLAHGGNRAADSNFKKAKRMYQLRTYNKRLQELEQSEKSQSLREEVAILRMTLEEKLNKCETETDLLMQAGPISDLILKIEKVVTSCTKLDILLENHLDKQAVVTFAQSVIRIISETIHDKDKLRSISDQIGELLDALSPDN